MTSPEIIEDLRYPVGKFDPATVVPNRRAEFIQIITDLPANIVNAVKGLSEEQLDTPYRPGGWTVRQTVHHVADSHINSYVRFKLALTEDEPPTIVGGDAILTAARVEPHVSPGQIWATDEFRQALAERPSLWRTSQVTAPDGAEIFNVKKVGRSEPDLLVRLFRLEF